MRYHYIIPPVLAVIALTWIYIAITEYGLWNEGPAGGFMPTLAATILLIFSVVTLCSKQNTNIEIYLKEFMPVILILVLMGITEILGMLPAVLIMLAIWLRYIASYKWRFSLIVASCVTAAIWLIFIKWLNVPFPTGLF